ncbi:MAG: tetratricopeptide repeat protein [Verrucomicrobia bacterium]|nr:tetratricopeptide repeat protein [Verrucomicrobiota bacterium]
MTFHISTPCFVRAALASLLITAGLGALPRAALAADPEEAHYNAVVSLYNAGQWKAAISKIDAREKQSLSDAMRARYLYARGLALEKGGRKAEARAVYQRLTDAYPTSSEAERARLSVLYLDYAARDFEAVLKDSKRLDAAKLPAADRQNLALMRAEALYALKKDTEAIAAFDQAVKLGADRASIALKLFELNYRAGRYADVLAVAVTNLPGMDPDRVAVVRAEAFMGLNKPAEATTEADKVAAGSPDYPRACLIKAQALIKQGRLKDALPPLQTAVKDLRDPPAPLTAHLALVECLLDGGRADEAVKVMARAEALAAALPDAESKGFAAQTALLKLRLADKTGSAREIVRTVDAVQSNLPPEMLSEALYMRAYALHRDGNWTGLTKALASDYPRLQGTAREGPATLLFAEALARQNQASNRIQLLEGYVARKPQEPDALRARLALANVALESGNETGARLQFKALLGAPKAAAGLGTNAYRDIARNAVALALKTNDAADAIRIAKPLASGPAPDSRLLIMLGQAYALNKQLPQAVAVWKQALKTATGSDATEARARLVGALFAAGDFKGAREQLQALAAASDGESALKRELRELWARASFNLHDFTDAAVRYQALADAFRDVPAYAYESAAASERAGRWADAVHQYAAAAKAADKLPLPYASSVEGNLARARLEAGLDDRGAAIWIARLAPAVSNAPFESAVTMMSRCIATGNPKVIDRSALEKAMAAYPADTSRHYSCGALLLQLLAARGEDRPLADNAARLADDYAAHESALAPGSSGTTLAPAMIYYYRGEAARRADTPAKALPDFETVLAAYPYNEWPDAAAFGAAECYAALGDSKTARAKLEELVQAATTNSGSAVWRDRAKQRLTTLSKEDSR